MARTFTLLRRCMLFLIAGGLCGALAAAPAEIDYRERVVVKNDGSADVAISVICSDTLKGELRLPWGFPAADHASTNDSSLHAEIRGESGLRFLVVTGTHPPIQPLLVSLHVPRLIEWETIKHADFGNMTLTHQFRNTVPTQVKTYRGEFYLPEGLTISSIVSSVPPQTEKDPVAPFEIVRDGARSGLFLKSAHLRMGDVASITFRCKPDEKSPVLFGLLILVAGLYLIFFRDVLKEKPNGPVASQDPQA